MSPGWVRSRKIPGLASLSRGWDRFIHPPIWDPHGDCFMTEGTAIILLVIAELGVVLAIAGIVGAILWTRRKQREQRAVAELITTLTDRQDTRRVTLTGWLTHNLGYPEAEVASRVEQLLEAEMGIYRRMATPFHETDAERLAGIMAGMDILTHLYRDTVAAA